MAFNKDSEFNWREKRVWIPWTMFTGWLFTSGACTGGAAGAGTGAPVTTEAAATGLAAPDMHADGDMIHTVYPIPYDFDPDWPLFARVWWSTESTTAADKVDWILTYQSLVPGTTVMVTATTALDTAISLDDSAASTSANIMQYSDWGKIGGGTFGKTVEMWNFRLEQDSADACEEIHMWGLELAYTRRLLRYHDGMKHQAYPLSTVLGTATR